MGGVVYLLLSYYGLTQLLSQISLLGIGHVPTLNKWVYVTIDCFTDLSW
jgi:hypothetical protein